MLWKLREKNWGRWECERCHGQQKGEGRQKIEGEMKKKITKEIIYEWIGEEVGSIRKEIFMVGDE